MSNEDNTQAQLFGVGRGMGWRTGAFLLGEHRQERRKVGEIKEFD